MYFHTGRFSVLNNFVLYINANEVNLRISLSLLYLEREKPEKYIFVVEYPTPFCTTLIKLSLKS